MPLIDGRRQLEEGIVCIVDSHELIKKAQKKFTGLAVNSGKVVARVCLYSSEHHKVLPSRIPGNDEDVARELERFSRARQACGVDLDRTYSEARKTIGKVEAEIFVAQKHILNDPVIVKAIEKEIREKYTALEPAIAEIYGVYEEKFNRLDDEYLRQRSSDIAEIRRRLLDHLYDKRPGFKCEGQEHCRRGKNRVIVARELTAEMMVHMNLEHVLGIVTERGGVASHAAIIARSVGVPSVSGIHGIFDSIVCGTEMLVDGDNGVVIVEPDDETIRQSIPVERIAVGEVSAHATPDGMEVLANASLVDDVRHAVSLNADGIGLFRTELLFMRNERLLGENEQYDYYRQVMELMAGKPVTFRLLDVGGDKELPFLRIERESNPFLGWRGARFLLGNPDIFSAQVSALLRLSERGEVRILFPMVIDKAQTAMLIDFVRTSMKTPGVKPENVRLGVMFEVPSACAQADEILQLVDFASIGSNDLIQYLFAVDRNNEMVSHDYNPEHPVLWNILESLSDAARRADTPLSICGEMAGREGMATRLLDIGITSLSVSSRLIPRVRGEMARYVETRG